MRLKNLLTIIFSVLIICNIHAIVTLISAILIIINDILWLIIDKLGRKDGTITIIDTEEKTTWAFELSNDPEKIRKQKSVTFGVKDSSS